MPECDAKAGPKEQPVPICAIGASAGGVKALQTFFRQVPSDLGLAYVVIVHLAPDHPSALGEILSSTTEMPVLQVADKPTLRPNCAYVIAPDRELVIEDDTITSRPAHRRRAAVHQSTCSFAPSQLVATTGLQ